MSDKPKNKLVEQEERTLQFWRDHDIFEKSLEKNKNSGKEFVFYEGPPTANGRPGIHHLEARAFKDAIPRFKTMQGFHVRRKGGWDTHGLPVELQVEKELGLKSKKEIEKYGIAEFNKKCKDSVWTYVHEWEDFTRRIGYWVDLKDPYITYKPHYIESLWNIVKTVYEKGLLYKDYKVVPWCPRCGTALSSHELAQGYEDVKDLAVTVKFRIVESEKLKVESRISTYLLAWTTTPWTLPGNVALAVGKDIDYVKVKVRGEYLILAKERLISLIRDRGEEFTDSEEMKGRDLVGLEYEPLYPFLKDNIVGKEKEKLPNAFKVYAADFVTTTDGTGIVHTAVMYGQDDFELGNKVDLPKYHLVNDDGTFKSETGFLTGKFVKDEATDVEIIKDLAHRGLLFAKEKYSHSYPHCWRCHTPLIYFARDSWYIKMSAFRDTLVKENESINWEPSYIKEGRFGEWLRDVKDWAISRERYWGTPLPVWKCQMCKKEKVIGSIADLAKKTKNTYYVMRHGEAENNTRGILDSRLESTCHLTDKGKEQVEKAVQELKKLHIDLVIASPILRTTETADIVRGKLGLPAESLLKDERIREYNSGEFDGHKIADLTTVCGGRDRFVWAPKQGETYADVKKRVGKFLYELEGKYSGKTILIIPHETPAWLVFSSALGLEPSDTHGIRPSGDFIHNAELKPLEFSILPHNENFELDLHRPYIDEVKFTCSCGGEMTRVKEVMDVWFDSGVMPFAQDHYPFDFPKRLFGGKKLPYPADFISEGLDQTRGWFYTLHAIGILMGKGKAYKNVIVGGTLLDAQGKKMSKSLGNTVDPLEMMEKYGADPLRFWMYSVNQPGESKNFDERTVDEVVKKVFNLATNVLAFYELYATKPHALSTKPHASHILDTWILSRLDQLTNEVTKGLESYKFLEPTRAVRDFIADLSQWYIRRSRGRFKEEGKDKESALATTRFVLLELSKLMAPFTPFFAEYLYKAVGGEKESIHLEDWPQAHGTDKHLLSDMEQTRKIVSLALEARAKAGIKVRQPLANLKIKTPQVVERGSLRGKQKSKLANELLELIKDEVNVKKVLVDEKIVHEVELDTTITPELKKEGDVREIIRTIQELRKEKGLKQGEMAVLVASPTVSGLVKEFEEEIKKAASLSKIEQGGTARGDFELK